MDMKKLGHTDMMISPMGLGAWAIGGEWQFLGNPAGWGRVDDAESINTIHTALDMGVNLIDTAANYGAGHSERIVGQAVKHYSQAVVIATKFGYDVDEANKFVQEHTSPSAAIANIRNECEQSLRNLDRDVIDLYQLHVNEFPVEYVSGVLEELEKLVQAGKIRYYGWSTDHAEPAATFVQGEHCVAIQHSTNVIQQHNDILALTEVNNLTCLIRSPLAMGFLSDKYGSDTIFSETDVRIQFSDEMIHDFVEKRQHIRDILMSDGRTVVQGALAWLWARSDTAIPIPGMRTVAQAEENCKAMEFGPLSQEQMQAIDDILNKN